MRSSLLPVIATLACGGGGVHHLGDGGGDAPRHADAAKSDAAVDAAAGAGPVTIAVTFKGSAAAGVPVYFQNADSSLVASTSTDGSGIATAMMAPGGFVTVLPPQQDGVLTQGSAVASFVGEQPVDTFAGVKPGDQLHDDQLPPTPQLPLDVFVPVDANPAATSYELDASYLFADFAVAKPSGSGTLEPLAVPSSPIDVVVLVSNGSGTVIDALYAADLVAGSATVTLPAGYAPVQTETYNLVDVPAAVTQVAAQRWLATARGTIFVDQLFGFDNGSGSGTITDVQLPVGSDATEVEVFKLFPATADVDTQFLVAWGPAAGSASVDVGAVRLSNWTSAPVVDTAHARVTWSIGSNGIAPDYVVAEVVDNRVTGATTSAWLWRVAGPAGDDGAVQLPTLPTDIFDFNFNGSDSLFVQAVAGVQSPGGYDAARDAVLDVVDGFAADPATTAAASGSGTANVQLFQGK